MNSQKLAIIGSGPSSLYLLKHILDEAAVLSPPLREIAIFEKQQVTGTGMPYSPLTTDRHNMSNISSEELPALPVTFADWLRAQGPAVLAALDLEGVEIRDDEVYSRIVLGQYFKAQYHVLTAWLADAGIYVHQYADSEVTDMVDDPESSRVTVITQDGQAHEFDRAVIATGHAWPNHDRPEAGYYASPWPISKLLPEEGQFYPFTIGTLGASLSAFDVISSLAHRHGTFTEGPKGTVYTPHAGTEGFKIVMHSAQGLLPHLQFDQVNNFRLIYRHVDREGMQALLDGNGFLRLEKYFDQVCRPVLQEAFEKDEMPEMVQRLADPDFNLLEFIEAMQDKHEYSDAFEGMRKEMVEAEESVENHRPIHWKEVIDDLMYTLNFHVGFIPAEDILILQKKVMPFLMNVIAAMPLPSGNSILALHDAGKLELVSGKVTVVDTPEEENVTTIEVDDDGNKTTLTYRMFIDCSGQQSLDLESYPFTSLVKQKSVRKARTRFVKREARNEWVKEQKEDIFKDHGQWLYHPGGIDVDGIYRILNHDGVPNPRIHDVALPHLTGLRPYSYGLQACNHTAAIVVKGWVKEIKATTDLEMDLSKLTHIYEEVSGGAKGRS